MSTLLFVAAAVVCMNCPAMLRSRLKELRKARGWSQEAPARRANTTNQEIGKLEKGDRRTTLDWANRLGDALGLPPEDAIGAGIDRDLMRAVVKAVVELVDSKAYIFEPDELAEITVLLYTKMRDPAEQERAAKLPEAADALCAFAPGRRPSAARFPTYIRPQPCRSYPVFLRGDLVAVHDKPVRLPQPARHRNPISAAPSPGAFGNGRPANWHPAGRPASAGTPTAS